MLKRITLALLCSAAAWAQITPPALTQSTLTSNASAANVALALSYPFPFVPTGTLPGMLYVDSEAMTVVSASLNLQQVTVQRGARGTTPATHYAGAVVFSGGPAQFIAVDKSGACDPNSPQLLNVTDQKYFTCTAGSWVSASTAPTSSGGATGPAGGALSGTYPNPGLSSPLTLTGTTPGAFSLTAGTGSIPALPANSFGWAAPVTGGTSYLFKPPATITAGLLFAATPGSGDGVLESAITSKPLQGTDSNILTAGTVSGTGVSLCTDAQGGATTSGCSAGGGITISPPYIVSGGNKYIPTDNMYQATLPNFTGWTTLTGSATITQTAGTNGDIKLSTTGHGLLAAPTQITSMEAVITPLGVSGGNTADGIFVYDTTNSKVYVLTQDPGSPGAAGGQAIYIYTFTYNGTTLTFSTVSSGFMYTPGTGHLKLSVAAGTVTWQTSLNGVDYSTIGTTPVGTIAKMGFYIGFSGGSVLNVLSAVVN